jgi:glycosyltransferase involved in cell wall biosynthesis
MPKILALTKYGRLAASTRQRLTQFEAFLNANDFSIDLVPLMDDAQIERIAHNRPLNKLSIVKNYWKRLFYLRSAHRYDLIWIQYELFPYFPGFFEAMATWLKVPYVLDYDDAVFHKYDLHQLSLVRSILSVKLVPLMKGATAVMCGNTYIADYASQYCANVKIIPTVVDTDVYGPAESILTGDPLAVGWIGSPSTWPYLLSLLPTITPVLEAYDARMLVIGSGQAQSLTKKFEFRDWQEPSEVQDIQDMAVGIMPLSDTPWARGKCGYKLVQYMACNVPAMASPVGVNRDILANGQSGVLCATADDWVRSLDLLLSDVDERRRLGLAGRKRVVEHYSVASQKSCLLSVLFQALGMTSVLSSKN